MFSLCDEGRLRTGGLFLFILSNFRDKQNEKTDSHDRSYRVTDRRGKIQATYFIRGYQEIGRTYDT